jgi:hypothetical protein
MPGSTCEYEFPKGKPWPMKVVEKLYITDLLAWIAVTFWGDPMLLTSRRPVAHFRCTTKEHMVMYLSLPGWAIMSTGVSGCSSYCLA